eukprot:TRINITY_DN1740_c0_g4_i1.p1 TRINITY_DN1740_c0_g4~~TRINITY_DN1740_c0_g4_i1.p1  ORF type:complete len:318 (+),score=42.94 TRINITY_DN1740_c0_g4_i1:43-996(+)
MNEEEGLPPVPPGFVLSEKAKEERPPSALHKLGRAKLWNDEKSYGFISVANGIDVFCHAKPNNGASLIVGKDVWYTVGTQPNGGVWALDIAGPGVCRDPAPTTATPVAPEAPLPTGPGHHGKVKSWYPEKSFGFILHDDGRDVFCHSKAISHGSLLVGKDVLFSVEYQQNGKQWATNCEGPGYMPRVDSAMAGTPGVGSDPYGYGQYAAAYGSYYPYGYGDVGMGYWGQYPMMAHGAAPAPVPAAPAPIATTSTATTTTTTPHVSDSPAAEETASDPPAAPAPAPAPAASGVPTEQKPMRRRRGFDDMGPKETYTPY